PDVISVRRRPIASGVPPWRANATARTVKDADAAWWVSLPSCLRPGSGGSPREVGGRPLRSNRRSRPPGPHFEGCPRSPTRTPTATRPPIRTPTRSPPPSHTPHRRIKFPHAHSNSRQERPSRLRDLPRSHDLRDAGLGV